MKEGRAGGEGLGGVSAQKRPLRAELRAARRALSGAERAHAEAQLCARLLQAPELSSARVIGCYDAFDGEVDLSPLYQALLSSPTPPILAFPTHQSGEPLRFYQPYEWALTERSYRRPIGPELAPHELEVLLVPGVAFSLTGARLGFGGGFYDRTFPQLSRAQRSTRAEQSHSSAPFCFGVAFSLQVKPTLPEEPWDLITDAIACDSALIRLSKAT